MTRKPPGFSAANSLAVHRGAIDLHIGDVVIGEEECNQIQSADLGRDRIVEIPDDMHDILHRGLLRADIELVLDEPLDDTSGILCVDHAGRRHRARQQLGAVTGVRLHIQNLHALLDAGKGEHPGRLAPLIGLPVGIAAVGRGDDRLIVRGLGVLGNCGGRPQYREHRKRGKRANGLRATPDKYVHNENFPLVAAQHSKAMVRYHGLNRDGDAIVMGGRASLQTAAGGRRVALHAGRSKCPVALPEPPWLALPGADRQDQQTMIGGPP